MDYVGFTEAEVAKLCYMYEMDFSEEKHWYDIFSKGKSIFIILDLLYR